MMEESVITAEEMIRRFGEPEMIQLTNSQGDEVNGEVLKAAANRAVTMINSYIAGRVQALSSLPPPLLGAACDITRYYLYSNNPPDHVVERYKQAMKYLRDIAAGHVTLPNASKGAPTGSMEYTANPRVFTSKTLGLF